MLRLRQDGASEAVQSFSPKNVTLIQLPDGGPWFFCQNEAGVAFAGEVIWKSPHRSGIASLLSPADESLVTRFLRTVKPALDTWLLPQLLVKQEEITSGWARTYLRSIFPLDSRFTHVALTDENILSGAVLSKGEALRRTEGAAPRGVEWGGEVEALLEPAPPPKNFWHGKVLPPQLAEIIRCAELRHGPLVDGESWRLDLPGSDSGSHLLIGRALERLGFQTDIYDSNYERCWQFWTDKGRDSLAVSVSIVHPYVHLQRSPWLSPADTLTEHRNDLRPFEKEVVETLLHYRMKLVTFEDLMLPSPVVPDGWFPYDGVFRVCHLLFDEAPEVFLEKVRFWIRKELEDQSWPPVMGRQSG